MKARDLIPLITVALLLWFITMAMADEPITQKWLDNNFACVYGSKWAEDTALGLTIPEAADKLFADPSLTGIERYHFIHWALSAVIPKEYKMRYLISMADQLQDLYTDDDLVSGIIGLLKSGLYQGRLKDDLEKRLEDKIEDKNIDEALEQAKRDAENGISTNSKEFSKIALLAGIYYMLKFYTSGNLEEYTDAGFKMSLAVNFADEHDEIKINRLKNIWGVAINFLPQREDIKKIIEDATGLSRQLVTQTIKDANRRKWISVGAQDAFDEGKYYKAIIKYTKAIEMDSEDDIEAYIDRGDAYIYTENYEAAIKDFEKAMEIFKKYFPDDKELEYKIHSHWGSALTLSGQHEKALPHLTWALGFKQEDWVIRNWGLCQEKINLQKE